MKGSIGGIGEEAEQENPRQKGGSENSRERKQISRLQERLLSLYSGE